MLVRGYERLFAKDPQDGVSDDELAALKPVIGKKKKLDSRNPSGYTYLGQFIDHDLNLTDGLSYPPAPVDPDQLGNKRTPSLDLDSLYGGGLEDSVVPYSRDAKFRLDNGDCIPRNPQTFRAFIADQRNDENMFVGGIHLIFMKLHNRIIDELARIGLSETGELFNAARRETVNIYQNVVLTEFAKALLHPAVYREVVEKGGGKLSGSSLENPVIPIEFTTAAFRLHAMVRNSYHLQPDLTVTLGSLITNTGVAVQLGVPGAVVSNESIDWSLFFPEQGVKLPASFNYAKKFSPNTVAMSEMVTRNPFSPPVKYAAMMNDGAAAGIAALANPELHNQTGELNIAELTIRRGNTLGLASSQTIIKDLLGRPQTSQLARQFGLDPAYLPELLEAVPPRLQSHTPLWLFCMTENFHDPATGTYPDSLGILGSWLVADTLRNAAVSTAWHDTAWSPAKSVFRKSNKGESEADKNRNFTMMEIVRITNTKKN